jgi:hypothetical protein
VNATIRKKLARRKRRIQKRLDKSDLRGCSQPMFTASNIQYEIGERGRGIGYGGIGAIHLLVRKLGIAEAIDSRLHLLQIHLPYHESDHVLNLAYNALCDGTCLDDLELRRQDEAYLEMGRRVRPTQFNALPPEFRELGPSYRVANPQGTERWMALEIGARYHQRVHRGLHDGAGQMRDIRGQSINSSRAHLGGRGRAEAGRVPPKDAARLVRVPNI